MSHVSRIRYNSALWTKDDMIIYPFKQQNKCLQFSMKLLFFLRGAQKAESFTEPHFLCYWKNCKRNWNCIVIGYFKCPQKDQKSSLNVFSKPIRDNYDWCIWSSAEKSNKNHMDKLFALKPTYFHRSLIRTHFISLKGNQYVYIYSTLLLVLGSTHHNKIVL